MSSYLRTGSETETELELELEILKGPDSAICYPLSPFCFLDSTGCATTDCGCRVDGLSDSSSLPGLGLSALTHVYSSHLLQPQSIYFRSFNLFPPSTPTTRLLGRIPKLTPTPANPTSCHTEKASSPLKCVFRVQFLFQSQVSSLKYQVSSTKYQSPFGIYLSLSPSEVRCKVGRSVNWRSWREGSAREGSGREGSERGEKEEERDRRDRRRSERERRWK